ncbi:hypothetical protein DRE_01054 [Drechslerella stenobrocha 248]|uniref:Uncharacterized protein n=1 Tax=Drechslerella stenobrocha 248 TaxID=1043628 RepID=W7HWE1_9PEZI|nr:hypothetical protein DRE_01054 [Drechslerella stenobrocha 248]
MRLCVDDKQQQQRVRHFASCRRLPPPSSSSQLHRHRPSSSVFRLRRQPSPHQLQLQRATSSAVAPPPPIDRVEAEPAAVVRRTTRSRRQKQAEEPEEPEKPEPQPQPAKEHKQEREPSPERAQSPEREPSPEPVPAPAKKRATRGKKAAPVEIVIAAPTTNDTESAPSTRGTRSATASTRATRSKRNIEEVTATEEPTVEEAAPVKRPRYTRRAKKAASPEVAVSEPSTTSAVEPIAAKATTPEPTVSKATTPAPTTIEAAISENAAAEAAISEHAATQISLIEAVITEAATSEHITAEAATPEPIANEVETPRPITTEVAASESIDAERVVVELAILDHVSEELIVEPVVSRPADLELTSEHLALPLPQDAEEPVQEDPQDVNHTEPSQQLLQELELRSQDALVTPEEPLDDNTDDIKADIDPMFLMEEETNQTPEKKTTFAETSLEHEFYTTPSALTPMSEAAINAGHAGPADTPKQSEHAAPDCSSPAKEPETPVQTPTKPGNTQLAPPLTATPRWQFMRHMPTVSSPLKRPPLTYSPSEATPPPPAARRRISENGIVSGSCDPSPLRTDELGSSDFATPTNSSTNSPANSPAPVSPRRISTPVSRKRNRSRSIRRESSPLKNAVDFTIQDGNSEPERSSQGPETPQFERVLSPLPRLTDYDPNQDISELREEEVPVSPATELESQNVLPDEHTASVAAVVPDEAGAPIPPQPAEGRVLKPLFEGNRDKSAARHSTGDLSRPKGSVEKAVRRNTLSGSIDVTTGPSRDIKHPRAAEARHHYLGPPPVVSADDYHSQFKSSVLGAPSAVEGDSGIRRAEATGSVVVDGLDNGDATVAPSAGDSNAPTTVPTEGVPAEQPTTSSVPEDVSTEQPVEQPCPDGPSDNVPLDTPSSDPNSDSALLDTPPSDPSTDSASSPPPSLEPESEPTVSNPEPEKKSRLPLPKPSAGGRTTPSPFRSRLNRVSQTTSLPDRELSRLTARNTTRNGVYKHVNFDRKVVRLDGQRPPSPTRETQSAAAEEARSMRKRVFEETAVALGPGDEVGYVPPVVPRSTKRVRWHGRLECQLDGKERARFRTEKGILAPERVRSESTGTHQVTIQKFLYEGERDILDEDEFE